jgi:hypothetical protein
MRTLIIIFIFVFSNFSKSENLIIPKQINDYITNDGCAQISDFYITHETVRGAPFIYELNTKTVEDYYNKSKLVDTSFAVWCQKIVAEKIIYFLKMKVESKLNPFSFCSDEIMHSEDVGKLSITTIREVPLSSFYDAESGKFSEDKQNVSGFVIESTFDGTGFQFYCDSSSNKWKVLPLD